jgi:hypothetical protein
VNVHLSPYPDTERNFCCSKNGKWGTISPFDVLRRIKNTLCTLSGVRNSQVTCPSADPALLMTSLHVSRKPMNLGAFRRTALLLVALTCATTSPLASAIVQKGVVPSVAVYGFEYLQNTGAAINTLAANGYSATAVSLTDIATGLPGYDVLYITHASDGGGWSVGACSGLRSFLAAGKGVVLEWDSSLLIFTSLGPNIGVHGSPQCALFAGVADRGQALGPNTPIKITDPTSPLVAGLVSPFSMGLASDYMYQITGFDTSIWKVSATYTGWGGSSNAALMYARYKDAGCIALGMMAFGDNGYLYFYQDPSDTSSHALFLNMIGTATPGQSSCRGALQQTLDLPIPALSPAMLVLLLAMIGGSAVLLRRRFPRRHP